MGRTETKGRNGTIAGPKVRLSQAARPASARNFAGIPSKVEQGIGDDCRWRCCQTNANQSQFPPMRQISGYAALTPLGKGGGAVQLEVVPAVEVAFVVEVV